MAQSTFGTGAGGNDGWVYREAATVYPPDTSTQVWTTTTTDYVGREFVTPGDTYTVTNGLLRWDTSSLPDSASISGASLKIYVTAKSDADTRNLTGEWYDPGTIGTDDYTATASSTAFSTAISGLTTNAWNTITLSSPNSNISKTGYTGLRLHISGGQPTGSNVVQYRSYNHSSSFDPELVVDYTLGVTLTGGITPSGALVRRSNKALAGGLIPAGALVRRTNKPLAGTLTTAGVLIRRTNRVLVGTLTSSGALIRRASKLLSGSLTSSGTLIQRASKALAGTLTPSGVLTTFKAIVRTYAGTLTTAGALVLNTLKALTGSLAPDGALTKSAQRRLDGSVTPSGDLTPTRILPKTLFGTLISGGALHLLAKQRLAGALTPAGALVKRVTRLLAGALTLAGALIRQTKKPLAGSVTPAGSLTPAASFVRVFGGTLTLAGDAVRVFRRGVDGALTLAGALARLFIPVPVHHDAAQVDTWRPARAERGYMAADVSTDYSVLAAARGYTAPGLSTTYTVPRVDPTYKA